MINPGSRQVTGTPGITISIGPVLDIQKSDIVSVAKANLRILAREIDQALPGYPDIMSRYHLTDMKERIQKALKTD